MNAIDFQTDTTKYIQNVLMFSVFEKLERKGTTEVKHLTQFFQLQVKV